MAPKKPNKVKARVPRGFIDRTPEDLRAQDAMLAVIREVYERYGFEPVETPMFEYTDALGKFLPDSDRPNEGVFSLQDDDEEWLSLRYDLTAPLARYVAENFENLPKPYRSYRAGYVFRNEKPGPGRFRQFMQFDADIVGAPNVSADAEMAMMMADTMEALGIKRGDYVIRVNNRKVLDGVLDAIGLEGQAERRLTVLRAIDKLDKFGVAGVRELLGKGRLDESGDFTKGAELDEGQILRLEKLYSVQEEGRKDFFLFMNAAELLQDDSVFGEPTETMGDVAGANVWANPRFLDIILEEFLDSPAVVAGLEELKNISAFVRAAGYGTKRIRIDTSVVRGLEYYTGPVFEAELLFDVTNDKGEVVRFGSVGGGGRYDGLVARFMSQPVPATGFSIGVSRLQTALKNLGRLGTAARPGPVVVTVMDRDRLADYQRLTTMLRNGLNAPGQPVVPVEMFQGNPKQFGKQLQYADRRNSPCVVIQGGDEKAAGKVQVKDLVLGKEMSEGISDNAEWREARAGQEVVDEAELVDAVRRILARQASERLKQD
ncbi:histidine--tRNA ligase [Consotaella salsifontis]|uniref:Histidine--tRNA ligase n=1 Tax=Consotaella salsifontis TaxID=1365950 RepID=A0A1T4Q001_9HYPH|nr:histidine--tRNA ligase [Consotaella salsifontis]SJZ96906.1 histidyl-tRNA synthetase [Consotaella salsifontis]